MRARRAKPTRVEDDKGLIAQGGATRSAGGGAGDERKMEIPKPVGILPIFLTLCGWGTGAGRRKGRADERMRLERSENADRQSLARPTVRTRGSRQAVAAERHDGFGSSVSERGGGLSGRQQKRMGQGGGEGRGSRGGAMLRDFCMSVIGRNSRHVGGDLETRSCPGGRGRAASSKVESVGAERCGRLRSSGMGESCRAVTRQGRQQG